MCQTKCFTLGSINVLLSPYITANAVSKAKQENVKQQNIVMKKFRRSKNIFNVSVLHRGTGYEAVPLFFYQYCIEAE